MLVDRCLRYALPGRCAFCLGAAMEGAPWCRQCLDELPWNRTACSRCAEPFSGPAGEPIKSCGACLREPPSFVRARVPLCYSDPVAAQVQRFKFSASPRAGAILLSLLQGALTTGGDVLPEALVAVPLHEQRARERGFDQADWLGSRLAQRLGMRYIKARRLRSTPTQRGLSREQRRANLKSAFVIDTSLPASVAILDDVMTTGATLDALGQACLEAGADHVEAWAVARTPMH
ncbi:ComF family protein [Aidingimonas lacisalsi]|uniref:ComF family protein n=1 Tax=Aidingimonas lacisalsi TaxID=2604086 RepID=UPI0022AA0285|nr:ComF family protein [Aidingimonas lacisalsi]